VEKARKRRASASEKTRGGKTASFIFHFFPLGDPLNGGIFHLGVGYKIEFNSPGFCSFFCLTLFVAAAATAFRKIFIKSTLAAEWRIERDEASGAKEKGHWPRAAH